MKNENTKEITTNNTSVERKEINKRINYRKNLKNESNEKKTIRKDREKVVKRIGNENKSIIDLGLEGIESDRKMHSRINNKSKLDFSFKKSNLKIIALGGLDEIGKNITVFEYEDEIVLVDCGLEFPEDDMLGVDLVIPDVTYLIKNKEKIKGLVVTHGHEDHIGAIPYILKQVNMPIFATKLTARLIEHKLEEHHLKEAVKVNVVNQGETVNFGKIKVEFIRSSHSIPDAVMLAIHTPVGTVVHTGDFKVDYTPIDGQVMDFGRLAELGNKGVLALLADSTNSERKGYTMSEKSIGPVFDKLFEGCKKRIVVATFASNVHRVHLNSSSNICIKCT